MPNEVVNVFIRDYLPDVVQEFQAFGPALADTVMRKDGVVGKTAQFTRVGQGKAAKKSRHGYIPPMDVDQTPIVTTLEDFYAASYIDRLDEPKTNTPQRMIHARAGAQALGREIDDQITTVLDATTQATQTWDFSSKATVLQSYLESIAALMDNNAFSKGETYMVLNPTAFNALSTVEQFASADYVDVFGRRFNMGPNQIDVPKANKWKDWDGVFVSSFTRLPSGVIGFLWNKMAVGFATQQLEANVAQSMGFEFDQSGTMGAKIAFIDERAAWFVNHWMSSGAVMVDDAGVLQIGGTAAIPSS